MPTVIAVPPTSSPGRLALFYHTRNLNHQVSVNFINGVDINNIALIRTDANSLAVITKDCLTADETIVAWGVLSREGVGLYREAFGIPLVGTHSSVSGMDDYESARINVLGKGAATGLLSGSGRTEFELYTLSAYRFQPGQRYVPVPDAELTALTGLLDSNLRFWADFYGQHADTTGYVAIQFDAHVQATFGC